MRSTIMTVLLTAAVALPIGYVAAGPLRGHPNLEKARNALNDADHWITKSQEANEAVWKDEGGHGKEAKEAIAAAKVQLDKAAEWVNNHK
jgi:hypothetical protein